MFNIIVDTGFWIALLDPMDDPKKSQEAELISETIENFNIIIPYPTLYEFVNTKLSRKAAKLEFERILGLPNVMTVPDATYRDKALKSFFLKAKK
jgi:predicted nucleic acid-binding protein